MVDRVAASIQIGGSLSFVDFTHLAKLISEEELSIEWDGPPFDPAERQVGEPLFLYAYEVAWGRFENLEAWCVEKALPFSRWSGARLGQWGGERLVFTGLGSPVQYAADEEDYILMGVDTAKSLGSFDAIIAYFAAADVPTPPLVVEGDFDAPALSPPN